ncbi:MAG: class I SAM-dependent methyltransferase, partial [Clostridia bacterium]|nr:class I SAM-dependent methyltransferase [Clostridia bacterium]
LLQENHANLAQVVTGKLDAIMFNLGYLPGSDHQIKTNPADTLAALEQALSRLSDQGRMSVIVYTGHPGSGAEARVVAGFAASLPENYTVVKLCFWNGPRNAPELYLFSHSGVSL